MPGRNEAWARDLALAGGGGWGTGVRTHFQGQQAKKRPKDASSEVLEWGGQELGIGDPATSPTSSQVSLMVDGRHSGI